jgi:hypothetical protein
MFVFAAQDLSDKGKLRQTLLQIHRINLPETLALSK